MSRDGSGVSFHGYMSKSQKSTEQYLTVMSELRVLGCIMQRIKPDIRGSELGSMPNTGAKSSFMLAEWVGMDTKLIWC